MPSNNRGLTSTQGMGKVPRGWSDVEGLTIRGESWGVTPDTLFEPETATLKVLLKYLPEILF